MKFADFPYQRPDYPAVMEKISDLTAQLNAATSAQQQIDIYKQLEELSMELSTASTICTIRYTVDTRDKFYSDEQEYNEQMSPLVHEKLQEFEKALYHSKFRPELEKEFGSLMFKNIEISLKSFSPELIPLIQEENQLIQQYQKLCASAKIEFNGKICNLSQLGPYQQSPDREVRKAATQAYGKFFDDHQAECDEIYDKLVKNRTEQAHKLGLPSYVEMAFLLRGRNCYAPEDIANFRRQVVEDIVPVNNEIKRTQAKRIGVDHLQVYDNTYFFADGNPLPHGTPEELMEAGRRMYTEMSPETAEFIKVMFDYDLFDVLSKEGKAMGGYCTSLPKYHVPFIFANWNGTAGDVDVLTHEAGHAFADYMADKCIKYIEQRQPTMEVCESHSMSMEFLTAPWHHLFFKEDTDKYELFHAESAMTFVPYGCQVDHFQESVYRHPEWTPAQRNEEWNRLEKLYRPHLDNSEVNFYNRGAGWQRQLHIYECPFYYIDYSLAQMISLQFWSLSMHDHKAAWDKYLSFVKMGGTKTFVDIVKDSGLQCPIEDGSLKSTVADIKRWLETHQL
ncbi:M3 family oligoendopeptidase [uncultured Negativibacillus sp.]|uniref:M3 family oligoendopeptidase n=1 Tax=uncultured Negativibacillus sp. TaxID=1980696 RepID=UPI0025EE88D6|nr:M3 family oligoendopeptidase [uncultured Negativibacillus sp.]